MSGRPKLAIGPSVRALKQAVSDSEGVGPRLITYGLARTCVVQAVTNVARAAGPG